MALPGSSGKVAGDFGSFNSKENQKLLMLLHNNAAGNRWGPILRPAGLRARGQGTPQSFGRLQEALWRFQGAMGKLHVVLEGFWAEKIDFH